MVVTLMAGEKLRAFNGVTGETDGLSPAPNYRQCYEK